MKFEQDSLVIAATIIGAAIIVASGHGWWLIGFLIIWWLTSD